MFICLSFHLVNVTILLDPLRLIATGILQRNRPDPLARRELTLVGRLKRPRGRGDIVIISPNRDGNIVQIGLAVMRRVKRQRQRFAGQLRSGNQDLDPGMRASIAQQVTRNIACRQSAESAERQHEMGIVLTHPATEMQRHLEVSHRQKDEVEQQLKALGSDTSTLKDMAMRLAGRLEPLLSGVTSDDMPKHCIAAHSWEQFEIGAYRSMLGAAEELGMSELQQMCERFIREEQEMANVFFEQLPAITRQYLREYATL